MGLFSELFGGGKRQGDSGQQGNAQSDEAGNWVSLQVLVDDIADTIHKNQIDLDWIAVDLDMSPRYVDAFLNIHEIGARFGDNKFYRFRDHGFATPSDPRLLPRRWRSGSILKWSQRTRSMDGIIMAWLITNCPVTCCIPQRA